MVREILMLNLAWRHFGREGSVTLSELLTESTHTLFASDKLLWTSEHEHWSSRMSLLFNLPEKKRLSAVEALQFQHYVARSLGTFPCKLFVQQCSVLFEQTLLWLDDGVSKSSPWGFALPPPTMVWVCGALNGGIRDRIAYRTTIGDHRDQCNRSLEPSSWCRPCDFSCVSSVPSHHTMGLT